MNDDCKDAGKLGKCSLSAAAATYQNSCITVGSWAIKQEYRVRERPFCLASKNKRGSSYFLITSTSVRMYFGIVPMIIKLRLINFQDMGKVALIII